MARTYAEIQPDIAPGIQKGETAQKLHTALGMTCDAVINNAVQAVESRFASIAPSDALDMLGWNSRLARAVGEPLSDYRARVQDQWKTALARGTRDGLITQLNDIGFENVRIYEDGPLDSQHWKRYMNEPDYGRNFAVVIDPPHPFGDDFASYWDDPNGYVWSNQTKEIHWGTNGDPTRIQQLINVLKHWRPVHAKLQELIIILDGSMAVMVGDEHDGDQDTGAKILYIPFSSNTEVS